MIKRSRCVVLVLVAVMFAAPLWAGQESASKVPPLRVEKQGSFFVGGHEVHSDTLSSTATRTPNGTITVETHLSVLTVDFRHELP